MQCEWSRKFSFGGKGGTDYRCSHLATEIIDCLFNTNKKKEEGKDNDTTRSWFLRDYTCGKESKGGRGVWEGGQENAFVSGISHLIFHLFIHPYNRWLHYFVCHQFEFVNFISLQRVLAWQTFLFFITFFPRFYFTFYLPLTLLLKKGQKQKTNWNF